MPSPQNRTSQLDRVQRLVSRARRGGWADYRAIQRHAAPPRTRPAAGARHLAARTCSPCRTRATVTCGRKRSGLAPGRPRSGPAPAPASPAVRASLPSRSADRDRQHPGLPRAAATPASPSAAAPDADQRSTEQARPIASTPTRAGRAPRKHSVRCSWSSSTGRSAAPPPSPTPSPGPSPSTPFRHCDQRRAHLIGQVERHEQPPTPDLRHGSVAPVGFGSLSPRSTRASRCIATVVERSRTSGDRRAAASCASATARPHRPAPPRTRRRSTRSPTGFSARPAAGPGDAGDTDAHLSRNRARAPSASARATSAETAPCASIS